MLRFFNLFYFLAISSLSGCTSSCPDGFTNFDLDSFNCYMFGTDNVTWTGAFTRCKTAVKGANVLSISSAADFYPLAFYSSQGFEYWSGLLNIGGTYSWADGTAFNTELEQFIDNESSTDLYGYLSQDSKFHFSGGTTKRDYICYIDTTPATTTPEPTTTPAPPPTTTTPPCDAGWQQYLDQCYLFSTDTQYWAAAGHNCHQQGAEPVSIHDKSLLTFLLLNADHTLYWTGLENEGGTFVYEDGSSTDDVDDILGSSIDEWTVGNDCLVLDADSFPKVVVHKNCFSELQYVCYKPANN